MKVETPTTLTTTVPLSEVTQEQLDRALEIDQQNNDTVQKLIKSGDHRTLPGNWDAASELPLKSPKLAERLAGGIMSAGANAAMAHSMAPFSVMALRFMTLGYELGLIAAEEAQAKQIN